MNLAFWRGKRVLITGHTGFKGGWLSLWLTELGAEVTGFALPPCTEPALFDELGLGSRMRSVLGDVCDSKAVLRTFQEARPEIVIHMAAQPLVRYSYANPVETYATNVLGLVNVYEAIRQTPEVRAVVNVTSDKCYENREWEWGYRENEAMGGYDPYSSSKGCAELVTAAYRRSYFQVADATGRQVALGSGRAGNVIGGGDWSQDRLLPDVLRAFLEQLPARIRNPHSIRPWQHVLEPLRGYLVLAERLYEEGQEYAEGWNFGPADSDARPVQWIVERMSALWGDQAAWSVDAGPHDHEARYLKLDCSKAAMRLGWRPCWPLEESLERIVAWHREAQRGGSMMDFTLAQIRDYQACVATN
ncbi:CDP-glucose 4,6-dehydratase [Achromobacter denitrificans]|uniref:CDP-glucose 4,6-dehydratase n=1 Tax=Achromobacter denitrificans TaxID=32002 RepID=UPI0015952D0E|nr:CDP-glucose 4,6-dehydratase [Achromobacter denitrificans]MDF3942665.1 CDP-glucose 4,6-dehydratase [Achromobacter denitrificans]